MSEKYELPPVFGTTEVERSLLDPSLFSDRFKDLEQGGKCLAEYVWIGGTGMFRFVIRAFVCCSSYACATPAKLSVCGSTRSDLVLCVQEPISAVKQGM